jgi:hypothetical protein
MSLTNNVRVLLSGQSSGGLSLSSQLTGLGSQTGAVTSSDTILSMAAKVNDRLPLSGGTLTGDILNPNAGAYNQPQFRLDGYETGIALDANSRVSLVSLGVGIAAAKFGEGFLVRSTESIGFSSAEVNGSATVRLFRDADDILAQGRGANAQEFRLYGTYTDASNYERLALRTAAGDYLIAAEAAGGGTLRNLVFNAANRVAKINDVAGTPTGSNATIISDLQAAVAALIDMGEAWGMASTS